MPLDGALEHLGLEDDEPGQRAEDDGDHQHHQPERPVEIDRERQQHHEGRTGGEGVAEEIEPQDPQCVGAGEHHLHQAAGMGFAVEQQRQLQHVVEEIGEHRLAALVGEAVGIERDDDADDDGEQPETDPRRDQLDEVGPRRGGALGLGAGERIDDPPEQHRLGEHGAGQREIRDREEDPELLLGAEQGEHPGIEVQKAHEGPRSDRNCELGPRQARVLSE